MFKNKKKGKKGANERRTWIDKLDKVFSMYIRLRDSKEFHFKAFRCISCGDVKPFDMMDCGHFVSRNAMAIRWNEQNCSGECRKCLTPDALILMEDLTWKPLGELQVMDKVFSFEEERGNAQARYWKLGIVTHIHREIQDVYEVTLENGDKIKTTANHKWLARTRGGVGYSWVETQNLWFGGVNIKGVHKTGPHTDKTCSVVCKPIKVVCQDMSNDAGWIAGMIDADGCICQQNIHNTDGTIRYGFRISVAQCEKYPDIALKIRKVDIINKLGMIRSRYDTKVKDVKYIGKQEIVVMETDTHTFIANGYAMHNCNRLQGDHLLGYRKNLIIKLGTDAIKGTIAESLPDNKKMLLIKKIGTQKVEALEAQKYAEKKWSVEELKEMYMYYGALVLELKNQI